MGKYVRRIMLLLLIAAAAYLGIRFYPVWKAAEYLHENMDFTHYSYELEVELEQEALQTGQSKVFEVLAGVTGFQKEDMCRLTVRGSVWEDAIHALIYPEGAENPLIELYLGTGMGVVNETYIYNAVRNHLAEEFRLLGLVMPEQNESLYMTLEQVEAIFGLDLKGIRNFSLPSIGGNISTGQYFIMLAVMSREKEACGSRFTLDTGQMEVEVEVPESTGTAPAPVMRLSMKGVPSMEEVPSMEKVHSIEGTHSERGIYSMEGLTGLDRKVARVVSQMLTQMGFPVSGGQLAMVKSFSVTMVPGGDGIAMPTDFVNQGVVELISRIRELVMKLRGG